MKRSPHDGRDREHGVEVARLSAPQAAQFGLPPGLVITGVIEGGSAELAGLRFGDLLIRLGSRTAPIAVTVTLQPDPVR